ncbi:MAG: hypothetical protein M0R17_05025 [Candidatus Omnitrophica bacterium]|jgi:hypothetical protein|nr:hypothetical protein [Candidatus Omnitrophota bacterium]
MQITLKKSRQKFNLGQNEFVAAGGEGKVYRSGSTAFKIYHDVSKMIPIGKIDALTNIPYKNVLCPRDICVENYHDIGFSMDYISDRIYLCWMYNEGWKQKNNIDIKTLIKLINIMRDTTIALHKHSCVVGDYNELQFLVNKNFDNVYFCDTDSYQISGYPCTAIMDTVRDRTVKFGQFSDKTDWFGFAIVTIQLFLGIHPYQGNHPDFSRREVKELKLMDLNYSIFNKKVTLPKHAKNLSNIPSSIRSWYEAVLEQKDRSIPPEVNDNIQVTAQSSYVIQNNNSFNISEVISLSENIIDAKVINGKIYCFTKTVIYEHKDKLFHTYINHKYDIIKFEYLPVIIEITPHILGIRELYSSVQEYSTKIEYTDYFIFDNMIYTVLDDKIIVHIPGILWSKKLIGNVFSNYQVFTNMIVQNVLGVPWLIIPNKDSIQQIAIKELTNHRIIDANYNIGGSLKIAIIISEYKSKYYRNTIIFKDGYKLTQEQSSPNDSSNFCVLNKSVAAAIIEDERLDLILDSGIKSVKDPPFDNTKKLFTDGVRVLMINANKILHISMR